MIVLETVGTGQSEIQIVEIAQINVVVNSPGMGDDIQAMKSGILEIADILVVNKADMPNAKRTAGELRGMLQLREASRQSVPVLEVIATEGKGIAQLATEIEAARLLVYNAARLKESGKNFIKEAAMAKLYCSELIGRVANHAVQIHGGYGLMKEYNVERFYRDQKLLDIGEGTSEVQRIVISRLIGAL